MTIDFYYVNESGPCRAVLLAAKAIGVDLNLIIRDERNDEFLKVRLFDIVELNDSKTNTRLFTNPE